jgi:hypothetical protein
MTTLIIFVGILSGVSGMISNFYKFKFYKNGLVINPNYFLSFKQLKTAKSNPLNKIFNKEINFLFKLYILNWVIITGVIILSMSLILK